MISIGEKIRSLRKSKGMKLTDIAKSTSLSVSFLSQIENGIANLSLINLTKIAHALDVPPGTFFEENNSVAHSSEAKNGNGKGYIITPSKRKRLIPSKGVEYQLLSKDMMGRVQFLLASFEPGSSTSDQTYTHEGEECGFILEGELAIEIDGIVTSVKEGESIVFSSEIAHKLMNNSNKVTRAIWVNCPPWF